MILFTIILGGCTVDVDRQTRKVLDDAVVKLTQSSTDWQSVIRDTIDKLPKDAQSFVRVELNNALSRGIAAAGSEIRCVVDFVGKRMVQAVIRVRAQLLHQDVPPVEPTFCGVNPPLISMADRAADPSRVQAVELHGYDFDTQPAMQVMLTDNNVVTDVTQGNLTRQTHYQMTLNLGGNGIKLRSTSQKISLTWNGRPLVEIPVIQRETPPCRVRQVNLDNIGSHEVRAALEGGDPEFGTNRPWVSAGVTLTNRESHVSADLWIDAREAQGGDTVGVGRSVFNIYSAPTGWRVLRILTPSVDAIDPYLDTTWEEDLKIRGGDGPVSAFHVWGDTHGWDVEPSRDDGTRVIADFRRVVVEETESGNCV